MARRWPELSAVHEASRVLTLPPTESSDIPAKADARKYNILVYMIYFDTPRGRETIRHQVAAALARGRAFRVREHARPGGLAASVHT